MVVCVFLLQEMPEKAPAGQLPRAVEVIADHDLVDSCKPGDRVQIVGQYRCLPSKKNGFTSGTFRTVLIANNVLHINKDENSSGLIFSDRDVGVMRRLSKRKVRLDSNDSNNKFLFPSKSNFIQVDI